MGEDGGRAAARRANGTEDTDGGEMKWVQSRKGVGLIFFLLKNNGPWFSRYVLMGRPSQYIPDQGALKFE